MLVNNDNTAKNTIIFVDNIKNGEKLCEEFKESGYTAEVITYETPAKDREYIYDKFTVGEIQILISVNFQPKRY